MIAARVIRPSRAAQGPLGQGVGSAAGDPEDREAVDSEGIGECGDILRPVAEAAAGTRVGEADAGTLRREDARAPLLRVGVEVGGLVAAARPAVEEEHGTPAGVAVLGVAQLAAIGQGDRLVFGHQRRDHAAEGEFPHIDIAAGIIADDTVSARIGRLQAPGAPDAKPGLALSESRVPLRTSVPHSIMNVIEAIESRRSIKHYDPEHVMPEEDLAR